MVQILCSMLSNFIYKVKSKALKVSLNFRANLVSSSLVAVQFLQSALSSTSSKLGLASTSLNTDNSAIVKDAIKAHH